MDKIELSIQQIMADVFEKSEEQISIDSTQDDIDSWDSIKHINLIVALEEEFGIELPIEEIGNLISFKLINIIVKEQLQNKSK
jgi:acyl carrier protein